MGMKNKPERLLRMSLRIILFLTIMCGFMLFGRMTIQARAECTLEFNGGLSEKTVMYYEVYKTCPGEYETGDTLKITENGKTYNLSYYLNDFYDANWKSLGEYGFGFYYQWDEDYDFWSVDENIGEKYSYRYFIYRVNEKGEPLDSEGNVAGNSEDIDICAVSQTITLTTRDDHIETTINGILYYVYEGSDSAEIIMCKGLLAGDVVLPKYVTIEGKSYPLRKVDSLHSNPDMKRLVLPDSVEEVTDYAFVNTGLKEVTIPDSVQDIGLYAFGYSMTRNSETGENIFSKVPGFVIYGTYGSEAYDYAYNNGLKFVDRKKNAAAVKVKITVGSLKNKIVKLSWKKVKDVSGFEVFKASKKKGKYSRLATVKKGTVKSWKSKKFTKVKKGKKLYFKIRPYTLIDGKKVYGKWSNIVGVRIRN